MAEDSQSGVNSTSESPQPCVRFSPGLSDQRQIFLLDILRKYNPESVLDIGCGEGSLLEAVCQPSFALPLSRGFDERHGIKSDASIRCAEDTCGSIHVIRVAGLDVSEVVLSRASESIQAIDDSSHLGKWWRPRPRWSTVDVKLWKGGLQVFNPEFRDYDVVLSSEVIEHLPQDILDCFCPMVLGRYAPKILAITTPGYEFNQLFTAPDLTPPSDTSSTPVVREGAYLDPTGRTQRCFRHHDHKFEWTRSEFQEWCMSNASRWGYSVVIFGVGRSAVQDPWGRDESKNEGDPTIFASQTAIFTRTAHDIDEHRNRRESEAIKLIQTTLSGTEEGHQLFAHHKLDAHPRITRHQPSLSNQEVLEVVKAAITDSCNPSSPGEMEVWDLWNIDTVSLACQGNLERLYEVLEAEIVTMSAGPSSRRSSNPSPNRVDIEWEWINPMNQTCWTRKIRWNNYRPPKDSNNPWDTGGDCDAMENGGYQSGWGENNRDSPQDGASSWGEERADKRIDPDTIGDRWENAGWGPSTNDVQGQNDQKDWGLSLVQQEDGWGL